MSGQHYAFATAASDDHTPQTVSANPNIIASQATQYNSADHSELVGTSNAEAIQTEPPDMSSTYVEPSSMTNTYIQSYHLLHRFNNLYHSNNMGPLYNGAYIGGSQISTPTGTGVASNIRLPTNGADEPREPVAWQSPVPDHLLGNSFERLMHGFARSRIPVRVGPPFNSPFSVENVGILLERAYNGPELTGPSSQHAVEPRSSVHNRDINASTGQDDIDHAMVETTSGTGPGEDPTRVIELQYDDLDNLQKEDKNVLFRCPGGNDTFPISRDARRTHVTELITAIYNNVDTIESMDGPVFKKRWADGAKYYDTVMIERQAWRVLGDVIDLHQNGWTYRIEDPLLWESIQKSKDLTFQERWESIVRLLTKSKRRCDDLMKREKTWNVIGQAGVLAPRTITNKRSNDRKGADLKKVREEREAAGTKNQDDATEKNKKKATASKTKQAKKQNDCGKTANPVEDLSGLPAAGGEFKGEQSQQPQMARLAPLSPAVTSTTLSRVVDTQPDLTPCAAAPNLREPLGPGHINTGAYHQPTQGFDMDSIGSRPSNLPSINHEIASPDPRLSQKRSRDEVNDNEHTESAICPAPADTAAPARPVKRARRTNNM